jgi:hypothetical protein
MIIVYLIYLLIVYIVATANDNSNVILLGGFSVVAIILSDILKEMKKR